MAPDYLVADVWYKDVWDFQTFSQTFFEVRFSLANEGKDEGKNPSSQTWPGGPDVLLPDIRDNPSTFRVLKGILSTRAS